MKSDNRYTFIDYENLKKIKLGSLERLSKRLYIVVNNEHKFIPLKLVKRIQRLKCDVRWIIANTGDGEHVNFHIAFLMGKLHTKVNKEIAFVVISNDNSIDPLINCVIDYGRICTRVTRTIAKDTGVNDRDAFISSDTIGESDLPEFPFQTENDGESLTDKTIKETIRRLMNSDKPPANTSELKHYIARSNQEIARYLNIGEIVEEMVRRNEIGIENHQVVYNFLAAE